MVTDINKSNLFRKRTNLEGVSWHGANINGIINETKAHLPGSQELLVQEEKIGKMNGMFSIISSFFSKAQKPDILHHEQKSQTDDYQPPISQRDLQHSPIAEPTMKMVDKINLKSAENNQSYNGPIR